MKKNQMLVILILSVIIFISGCSSKQNKSTSAATDNKASFSLVDIKGEKHALADYKGKPLVVKYWASWCPICLSGLEEVEEISEDKEKDYDLVTIVSPSFRNEKPQEDFIEWFDTLDMKKSTVLLDNDGDFAKQMSIKAAPTYIFYNADGELIKVLPGHEDKETIEKNVADI